MTHAVLKTVAAFLNTEGGDLLIGVADDGSITGTEADKLESDDKFMLHLAQVVRNGLGGTFNDVTFSRVVTPLAAGLRAFGDGDMSGAAEGLATAGPDLARIGGSVLQRDVVGETLAVARSR